MTSFAAAIAALRTGRMHTDKSSTPFSLKNNRNAWETQTSEPTALKVESGVAGRRNAKTLRR